MSVLIKIILMHFYNNIKVHYKYVQVAAAKKQWQFNSATT